MGCFNPCFFGTRLRTFGLAATDAGRVVSILVFLELAFGQSNSKQQPRLPHVSILVFLELAFGPSWYLKVVNCGSGFNPCFFGTRLRTSWGGSEVLFLDGFNPCFFGTRLRTRPVAHYVDGRNWFQSLFFWNSPSDRSRLHGRRWLECSFNPCFFGTRLRTRILQERYIQYITFQSLFFWNSPSDGQSV